MDKKKFADILLKIEAVSINTKNPYTWASGIKSPVYCDNRILLSYPKEREEIVTGLMKKIGENYNHIDVIAGTATAGIPHAAFLAQKLNLPMVYVRSSAKEHGKQNLIEGRLFSGQKVLVIEDLISTGKSSMQVVNELKSKDVEVIGVLSIFTYGLAKAKDLFLREGICVQSLLSMPELLDLGDIASSDKIQVEKFLASL